MHRFEFGTASRLMLRPWRSGPVSALVAIYTITASLRCRSTAQFTPWSTTISVRSAISSLGASTTRSARRHWRSGAPSRLKCRLRVGRVAIGVEEPPLL